MFGLNQRTQHRPFIAARGFKHHEDVWGCSQVVDQLCDADRGVAEAANGWIAVPREVEPVLTNIDTNTEHGRTPLEWKGRERSRTSPALSVRTIVRQLFGRRREQPACGTLLVSGRKTQRETGTHVGLSAPD